MKREIERKGRVLNDQELKGILGGMDNPPTSGNNGSGPQTDARAVVIETGSS
jgi:hypothetical protein